MFPLVMEYSHLYFLIFPLLYCCSATNQSSTMYLKSVKERVENLLMPRSGKALSNYLSYDSLIINAKISNITKSFVAGVPTNLSGGISYLVNDTISVGEKNCLKDIIYILRRINTHWAIQMLDASGKISSGILLGNFMWMGKYDECSNVYVPNVKNMSQSFHGLYCIAEWNVTLASNLHVPLHKVPVRTGICLPDSCKALHIGSDLKQMMHAIYKLPIIKQHRDVLTLSSITCKLKSQKLSTQASLFLFALVLYSLIPASATIVTIAAYIKNVNKSSHCTSMNSSTSLGFTEFITDGESLSIESEDDQNYLYDNSKLIVQDNYNMCLSSTPKSTIITIQNVLKCFCLITNAQRILNTDSSTKQFQCIHGIRFLSMAWVILGHTYIHNTNVIDNYVDLLNGVDSLSFQVVIQGTFSVDVFFLIGGFLLGYIYLEEADKRNGNISWPALCFHRFIRLTPVYLLLISFNMFLFQYTGSGPFWGDDSDAVACKKYWWWNLLYINNFLPFNSMCLSWCWYLANDMQFFIFGSLILYVLWRWHYVGLSIFAAFLVCSWIITWYISYAYNIIPLFFGIVEATNYAKYRERILLAWNHMYCKPYCRIGPHLIGMLLAYALYKNNTRKCFLKLRIQVLGWSIAIFCSLSVIYGLYHIHPNAELLHFYNALSRSAFSLSVAWVIYCCLTGNAGLIDKFLSYKLWIPLSRLTYCAYLFHPLLMSWYYQSQRVPLFFTHTNMVMFYFAFLLASYGLAFIINIIFEAPLINLEKFYQKM